MQVETIATPAHWGSAMEQPHEMTFAEFAAIATAQKLGPGHGREWAVFNGSVQRGELMGYAEGPTENDALRMMHKNRVNNALYDNLPGAVHPPGMEPKSVPPQHVLDEYPDLQAKFAPAIRAQQHDRPNSPYQRAVMSFTDAGGDEREAYRILDSEMAGDFNPGHLADALVFHGFAKPKDAAQLAADILAEERRNVLEKEDRKAGDLLA